MKRKQNFYIIGIAILLLIGSASYWAIGKVQTQRKLEAARPSNSLATYTDTSKLFSLRYPDNWKVTVEDAGEGVAGENQTPQPDWSKEPRPFSIAAKSIDLAADPLRAVKVSGGRDSSSLGKLEQFAKSGSQYPIITTEGDKTIKYYKMEYSGDVALRSTDHWYLVTSKSGAWVYLSFAEKYEQAYSVNNSGPYKVEQAHLLPTFETIVKSVTFL